MVKFDFTIDPAANPWTVNHGLGDSFPFWVVFDTDGEYLFPISVVATSEDILTINWDEDTAGSGVILSSIDIVTFASTSSFTDLATVKPALGLAADDSTEDAKLTRLIVGISEAMRNYMGVNVLELAHVDELHNGQGTNILLLKEYPVLAASGVVVKVDDVVVTGTNYVVDNDTAIIQRKSGSNFPDGVGNLKVTYVSGTADGVPQDLNLACVKQVLYERRFQNAGNAISMSTANIPGVLFEVYRNTVWAEGVQPVMDRYRRRA